MLNRFSLKKKEEIKTPSAAKEAIVQVTGLSPIPIDARRKEEKPRAGIEPSTGDIKLLATYDFVSDNIPITIRIYKKKGEFVPIYDVSISSISKNTELILEKIRQELTAQVSL